MKRRRSSSEVGCGAERGDCGGLPSQLELVQEGPAPALLSVLEPLCGEGLGSVYGGLHPLLHRKPIKSVLSRMAQLLQQVSFSSKAATLVHQWFVDLPSIQYCNVSGSCWTLYVLQQLKMLLWNTDCVMEYHLHPPLTFAESGEYCVCLCMPSHGNQVRKSSCVALLLPLGSVMKFVLSSLLMLVSCLRCRYTVCSVGWNRAIQPMEIVGIICGQIMVGIIGDWVGRKFGLVQDAVFMFIGSLMLTAAWGLSLEGFVIMYTFSLFVYGFGVGGKCACTVFLWLLPSVPIYFC